MTTSKSAILDSGNTLYAAPEKLGAKGAMRRIDSRVDIYSAGVLLFELVYPMKTYQERSKKLGLLRKGTFPKDFKYATKFLEKVLSSNSSDRPSATNILKLLNDAEATATGANPEYILSKLLETDDWSHEVKVDDDWSLEVKLDDVEDSER
ncbi:hypothetical protein COLO4_10418 [Corchorus olitorius]|uniref:non-specific serine/threonine protein kinase n=1 Tax=Corchorus olitorius TaxID=93759 RepID=A0A1R3K8N3_9ROSI|nr:hypothetical protein COLO4_10418 [Corchorus olitorius]